MDKSMRSSSFTDSPDYAATQNEEELRKLAMDNKIVHTFYSHYINGIITYEQFLEASLINLGREYVRLWNEKLNERMTMIGPLNILLKDEKEDKVVVKELHLKCPICESRQILTKIEEGIKEAPICKHCMCNMIVTRMVAEGDPEDADNT